MGSLRGREGRRAAFAVLLVLATCFTLSAGLERMDLVLRTLGLVSGELNDLSSALRGAGDHDIRRPLPADQTQRLHGELDGVLTQLATIDRGKVPPDAGDLISSASGRVVYLRQAENPITYRMVQNELRLATFEIDQAGDSIDATLGAARAAARREPLSTPLEAGFWLLTMLLASLACALAGGRWLQSRRVRADAEKEANESRARLAHRTLSQRSELDDMLAMIAATSSGERPVRLARKA